MDWTRRLRLGHLHLLINLADTGSLSDTARLMHTTQPGLSKAEPQTEPFFGLKGE